MLKRIAENIWGIEHPIALGGDFRSRMTVVRTSGGVLLFSPVPIDDTLARVIAKHGEVRWIVAPNRFHHLYLRAAKERYPEALLMGPRGLPAKIGDLVLDRALDQGLPAELQDELMLVSIEGAPALDESVFYVKATQTLIVADLMFNLQGKASFGTRLLMGLNGCWGKPAQTRFFRMQVKQRDAFARSMDAVLALSIERIVPCHGEVVRSRGREVLRTASAWVRAT